MPLLIDGYNVLHQTGLLGYEEGPKWLEQGRRRLLEALIEYLEESVLHQTVVVFDAREAPKHLPAEQTLRGIRILFARDHAAADDLIEEIIAREVFPNRLLLVSSDHRLQNAARRRRAVFCESMDWYERLKARDPFASGPAAMSAAQRLNSAGPQKPSEPADASEASLWMEVFSGDRAIPSMPLPEKPPEKSSRVPPEKKSEKKPEKKPKSLPKPSRAIDSAKRKRTPDARKRAKRTLTEDIDNPFKNIDFDVEQGREQKDG